MNIFKQAYKLARDDTVLIYNGFGFKHLSDVTQYYVHPDNQSIYGKTSLAQSIGESVLLFSGVVKVLKHDPKAIEIFIDGEKAFIKVKIPEDYHENAVIDPAVESFMASLDGNSVCAAAYDVNGRFIPSSVKDLKSLYKLLMFFCVILAHDCVGDDDLGQLFREFLNNNYVDTFVNLHEDFYQKHKFDDYCLAYRDLSDFDLSSFTSYNSHFKNYLSGGETPDKAQPQEVAVFPENAFSKEQQTFIPNLSEEFVLPSKLRPLASAVTKGDIQALLFHGPAGTGKTMSCKLIAQLIGLPVMETINCTENLDEFVLGKFIPEDDKFIFKESYVTRAIKEGGAVVFEEINMAKPQHLAFLNSLLDDNGFVRLDNGEIVKRNENFRFFATMNMGYFGTKELNQALYNRFNAIVEIDNLSDRAIKRMLTARVPECEKNLDKILGVYHKLKQKIKVEALDIVISPRNLENWAKLARYEGYRAAAETTIVPIAKTDRVLEEAIRSILNLYKWD